MINECDVLSCSNSVPSEHKGFSIGRDGCAIVQIGCKILYISRSGLCSPTPMFCRAPASAAHNCATAAMKLSMPAVTISVQPSPVVAAAPVKVAMGEPGVVDAPATDDQDAIL